MNFYKVQDETRAKARYLYFLFFISFLCIVLLTNVAFAIGYYFSYAQSDKLDDAIDFSYSPSIYIPVTLITIIYLVIASFYKWKIYSKGGGVVAESLGGKLIQPNTDNHDYKVVLNVVEEMSLASSLPVPELYVLPDRSINAFAAGCAANDAAIGITEGAIRAFDREALQGVIAHEFSHILNGDMRLNIQMASYTSALTGISRIGRMMFYLTGGKKSKNNAMVTILGLSFMVIGALGALITEILKMAFNRTREFLADASAVQFTRNKDGIKRALQIIGGSQFGTSLKSPNSSAVSHMFFSSSGSMFSSMFASHPPLPERIKKIDPLWDGKYLDVKVVFENQTKELYQKPVNAGRIEQNLQVDPQVFEACEDSCQVGGLVLALLLNEIKKEDVKVSMNDELKVKQFSLYKEMTHINKVLEKSPVDNPFPVLLIASHALRLLSKNQKLNLVDVLTKMINKKSHLTVQEWAIFKYVTSICMTKENRKDIKERPHNKAVYTKIVTDLIHFYVQISKQTEQEKEVAFNKAITASGIYVSTYNPDKKITDDDLIDASNYIECESFLNKRRVITALATAAKSDNKITEYELGIIMALGAIWNVPIPRM